jgi:hypothetical protein
MMVIGLFDGSQFKNHKSSRTTREKVESNLRFNIDVKGTCKEERGRQKRLVVQESRAKYGIERENFREARDKAPLCSSEKTCAFDCSYCRSEKGCIFLIGYNDAAVALGLSVVIVVIL